MTRSGRAAVLALVTAAAAGSEAAAAPSGGAAAPTVARIDRAGYARLISSLRGQKVVVNMWATWCEACREEFPDLVKLHGEAPAAGVQVVAISMDIPELLESDVIPFLKAHEVSFPAYIKAPGDDEAFINGVDPRWSGALPATFIYDAAGRLARSITGPVTYEDLKRALEAIAPG